MFNLSGTAPTSGLSLLFHYHRNVMRPIKVIVIFSGALQKIIGRNHCKNLPVSTVKFTKVPVKPNGNQQVPEKILLMPARQSIGTSLLAVYWYVPEQILPVCLYTSKMRTLIVLSVSMDRNIGSIVTDRQLWRF